MRGGFERRMDVVEVFCFIWTVCLWNYILNPVRLTMSFNIPHKEAVNGELTGAWLPEKPGSCR